ncbi:MAG: hypothetical protein GEEBNDBF_01656 [bacterium]|nr:hypothetical protein [bacterium]
MPAGHRRPGFTLIELLVVITIIGILAAIALPNYVKAKDKAKEVQVKSALRSIQTAVERYHTDFEQYPLFLLGGDVEGWKHWHQKFDEPNPGRLGANAWVRDPLIAYSYFQSYPLNPFVDDGLALLAQTGPVNPPAAGYAPGDGDPRFGFRGNTMGNGLEHNQVFANWYTNLDQNIETYRTLWTTTGGNPSAKGFGTCGGPNYPGSASNPPGMHYTMGGRRAPVNSQAGTVFTHWPGNFFYRGFGERGLDRKGWTYQNSASFTRSHVARYMMGAYGGYTTEGTDAIRLEGTSPTGTPIRYRFPPPWPPEGAAGYLGITLGYGCVGSGNDWGAGWTTGLPEVAGGGNANRGPAFPPDRDPKYNNQFIYGAPDGQPDALVLILTAGDEIQAY